MVGIKSAVVVGVSNVKTSNLTCAVVSLLKGFEHITEKDVVDYVAAILPEYKRLHGGVIFVAEFPTNPSGKIVKRFVKDFAEKTLSQRLS